jgi:hypothetical protein
MDEASVSVERALNATHDTTAQPGREIAIDALSEWEVVWQLSPLALSAYRIAFTVPRSSADLGRPPDLAFGIKGETRCHWSSVRSLG